MTEVRTLDPNDPKDAQVIKIINNSRKEWEKEKKRHAGGVCTCTRYKPRKR